VKGKRRAFEPPVPGRNRRAARALWEALSPRQRAQMRRTQSFSIRGSDGGHYRCEIGRGRVAVRELQWQKRHWLSTRWTYVKCEGNVQRRWFLQSYRAPRADDALAAKLMLESRESHFLWLAQRGCGSLYWKRKLVGWSPWGTAIWIVSK